MNPQEGTNPVRPIALAVLLLLLLASACASNKVVVNQASDSDPEGSSPVSLEDRVQDWVPVGAGVLTVFGVIILILTLRNERRSQRLEVEAYVRVDLGTPQRDKWATDFPPPAPDTVAYELNRELVDLSDSDEDPMLSVWFRNQQDARSLGIALGIGAVIEIEFTDGDGKSDSFPVKPRIAYLEPGKCVQMNLMQFPRDWQVTARVASVEYRNLYSDSRSTQHGRLACRYAANRFESTPLSDPYNRPTEWLWRRLRSVGRWLVGRSARREID